MQPLAHGWQNVARSLMADLACKGSSFFCSTVRIKALSPAAFITLLFIGSPSQNRLELTILPRSENFIGDIYARECGARI